MLIVGTTGLTVAIPRRLLTAISISERVKRIGHVAVNIPKKTCFALFCALASFGRAAEPITLRFVVWDGDESSKVLKTELKNFEAAHPNIKVKFEGVDYAQYQQKLLAQFAAGVAPDVAMMDPANFQSYARRGAFLALDDLIAKTPELNIHEYYPSIVKAHSYQGKLYVLPRDIAPIAIVYYNKKMLNDAGVATPDGKWTWDFVPHPADGDHDFLNVLQKMQKKNAAGKVVSWGYVPGWPDLFVDMVSFGQGANYVDNSEDPTKLNFDDPRIQKAYQWYADLTLKQNLIPTSFDLQGTNSRQMFTQKKVAMYQSGIWDTPQLRKEIPPVDKGGFVWDIALAPGYRNGKRAYPTGGSGYSIMSSTRHPREAWELTRWMAGPHGMMAMARAGIAQPAIRSLALAEPWIPGPNTPEDQQVPHNRIITDQAEPYVIFAPTGILFSEVGNMARQPESSVQNGDMKADKAFTESQKIAQNRLDTLRKELVLPPFNWPLAGVAGTLLAMGIGSWVYWPERGQKRSNREKKEARSGFLFIGPWLVGLIVFTAGPMILSLIMSFADWDTIRPARWRGAGNYTEAFTVDPVFWKSLSVTLTYTLVAVPVGLAISLGLALLLNTKVKGIAIWRTCYYIPAIASPIAGALIWQKLLQPEGGLLNAIIFGPTGSGGVPGLRNILGPLAGINGQINWLQNEKTALPSFIIMNTFGAGAGMLILLAGLQGVPQYYYEAATLDGAGPLRKFRNITIPLISPALFFCMVTGFIGSFQSFTQAFQMTQGGPNNATMFFMLHAYNNAFKLFRMGYSSALAWILFVIILVFTAIQLQGNKFVHYEGGAR